VDHGDIVEENGRATLRFLDPEGQSLVLIDDRGLAHGVAWSAESIVEELGVNEFGPATIEVADPRLTRVLAFGTAEGDVDAQLHLP
jgi:glyoxalase family protein